MNPSQPQYTTRQESKVGSPLTTRGSDQLDHVQGFKEEGSMNLFTVPKKSLETALKNIFPEQKEETEIKKARRIMGDEIKGLTDEELKIYLAEFHYLIDGWLNSYEMQVFNGLTLQQMLRED